MTQQSSTAGSCPTSGACEHPCAEGTTRREFGLIIGAIALVGLAGDAVAATVTLATGTQSGSDRAYPIPPADGVTIDRDAQVILVRQRAHVRVRAVVPASERGGEVGRARQQVSMHETRLALSGRWGPHCRTRHPKHGSLSDPSRRQRLHVDVSRVFRSDADLAGWTAASLTVS